ncbi:MAG: hypothetical protein ABIH68_01110 [bacterium]
MIKKMILKLGKGKKYLPHQQAGTQIAQKMKASFHATNLIIVACELARICYLVVAESRIRGI